MNLPPRPPLLPPPVSRRRPGPPAAPVMPDLVGRTGRSVLSGPASGYHGDIDAELVQSPAHRRLGAHATGQCRHRGLVGDPARPAGEVCLVVGVLGWGRVQGIPAVALPVPPLGRVAD